MNGVCPKCGLQKEFCVCESVAKEEEKIRVEVDIRRYRKATTVISGFSKDVNLKSLLKDLKTRLACGGTVRNHSIELQGNHKAKVPDLLAKMGFSRDKIQA